MSTSTISSFLSQLFYINSYFLIPHFNSVPSHNTNDKKKFMNM